MTNRALKRRLVVVAIGVFGLLIVSFIEYQYETGHSNTYIGSHATLFALLVAAYLAYVFQQRGKFVDDLRKWWNEIVEAKSAFFIFCDKTSPTEDDYLFSFYKLSTAMDTLRLIYCNVDRSSKNPKGYYPFEQVRDIIDIARSVGPNTCSSANERLQAKQAINLIFQSLRHAIQSEAGASAPDEPTLFDSKYRTAYINEIRQNIGLDVQLIRKRNKEKDYISHREKDIPRARGS